MQLYQKEKHVLNFFLHFQNWDSILTILKNQMTIIAYVFSNWGTIKKMVR